MRLKNVPGADAVISACPYIITDPESRQGRWQEAFAKPQPLHIEVGMGKGQFLLAMAAAHPEINYLGIEKYSSVMVRAVEKQNEAALPNLRLLLMKAELLEEVFAPGEVDRLYLNFSDPWPKDRHADRRLTSCRFLERYKKLLAPGALLEFKTDNTKLFDFSLASAEEAGWTVLAATRDLHHDESLNAGNIMTEYEARFSALGNPICKMIARP